MSEPLLEIEGLSVAFDTPEGTARAVDALSLNVPAGTTVGLVGESGCGKSVSALSVLGLVPSPPGRIVAGEIRFQGRDLLALAPEQLRRLRGRDIAMIFQEPMTALNPVLPIGRQVAEPMMVHQRLSRRQAWDEAARWLERARIPAAAQRLDAYPHELSGGMRQRVMIAMAMVCRPRLLIADEPTTALDVTIQAQILALMLALKQEFGMAVLLITHDLGVVAQMAEQVVVMYAGQVVERAGARTLFRAPFHPYTRGLLRSVPRPEGGPAGPGTRLHEIKGTVPRLTDVIEGCKFAARCRHAFELCNRRRPDLLAVGDRHEARCWLQTHPHRRAST
jgi:oligopeptide/dipeptide ABC transporter ATP-binding protein